MNILLLNNNPVVTKLVTLSAQKSSDKLEIVDNIDEISSNRYDLVVVDDSLYSEEKMDELSARVEFDKSLYICSRNSEHVESFTAILKKPFLPTDLVDLFINFGKNIVSTSSELAGKIAKNSSSSDKMNDFSLGKQQKESENYDLNDLETLDDLDSFDDLEVMGDLDAFEDLDILAGEELGSSGDELIENTNDSILDKDDLKEVQTLLKETEKDEDDFELELDDEDILNNKASIDTLEEEFDFEDEELEDELTDNSKSTALESTSFEEDNDDFSLDFEDEDEDEDEDSLANTSKQEPYLEDDFEELEDDHEDLESDEEQENIESKIEEAMQNLSEEDLRSEIDGDILLDLDSLTSRDFKIAIGEELSEEESVQKIEEVADEPHNDEEFGQDLSQMIENEETIEEESESSSNDGVESLKRLLAALSNENIAASLKGMKISINITLGDK